MPRVPPLRPEIRGDRTTSEGRRARWVIALLLLITVGIAIWQSLPPAPRPPVAGPVADPQEIAFRAAQEALRQGDAAGARQHLTPLLAETSPVALAARCALGDLEFREGRIQTAERIYQGVLDVEPQHFQAGDRLGQLLALEGRPWEASPYLLRGLQEPQFSIEQLQIVGRPEALLNESMRTPIEHWESSGMNGSRRCLALAVLELDADHFPQAEVLLREAIDLDPGLHEAWARLGLQLAQQRDPIRFIKWREQLPPAAWEHPGVWTALAEWSQSQGEARGALRCYLEAVQRDPNRRVAVYQAGQLLKQLGSQSESRAFLKHTQALDELQLSLRIIAKEQENLIRIEQAARATESLGRYWEAQGWFGFLVSLRADATAQADLQRVRMLIRPDHPQTIPAANLSTATLRAKYALPVTATSLRDTPKLANAARGAGDQSRIHFTNAAADLGVDFRYFNDHDSQQIAMRSQESMGGGVLVVDFDQDGWPDIYATQGCQWPADPSRTKHLDRLFRNVGGKHFQDVSDSANLAEWGFSQGGTVGDFDNDGFPDLYIGNAGPNRFYHNNGDGTFTDITTTTGVAGDEWTTSCAMCDLNHDGLADIYAVGYLGGDRVYTLVCRDANNIPRSCTPVVHPPAIDRLFLNQGDGRFEEISETVAVDKIGRGLGIVIADFDGSGQSQIFVANDSEPNFYFVNQKTGPGERPQFVEQALTAGLALDYSGRTQASMGVAAGDADGNRRLDLLVTNYYHEGSTLYLQQQPNFFTDQTRASKLYEASFDKLGFGTQFLDADLDGRPDLVVGNGHEGNYSDLGVPFEMAPQFFHNLGNGQFSELPAQQLGPYFQGKYLARGLARLDWNRDGRADFAVSHLDAPLALLRNDSTAVGNWLGLRLHGVRSSRDAWCATVEAESANGTHWQQLVAGDGFHAANDHRIILGLGTAEHVSKLTIRWPSGVVDEFVQGFSAGSEWICVEGRQPVANVNN